jgi:hypothetical protein
MWIVKRILYCPEFRRLVLDFKGLYFVFRPWEFRRIRLQLSRIMTCPPSRAGLEKGERIRIRDSSDRNSLELGLPELEELMKLMDSGMDILHCHTGYHT